MKIAFFNWRDIRHPNAGGAEVFVHNIMRQLVLDGHSVTLFTSRYPGAAESDEIDGISHVRYGGKIGIYINSHSVYKSHIMGRYDVIIESINGIPFFTPLFAKERTVPYIHQLTRENWFSALFFPLALIGYLIEDWLLLPYRKCRTIVPSRSTANDLKRLGFRDISIIPGAAQIVAPQKIEKSSRKTLICLGRLTKSKRVDHAIRAFSIFRKSYPHSRLLIVGNGPEEANLRKMAVPGVEFMGFVDEKNKAELLASSHILLFPAVREGWGLVVLEANRCGTPVIGYDVPGLRDSIRSGVNGYLVKDVDSMAQKAIELIRNGYDQDAAIEYSKKFSWEKSAREIAGVIG